MGVYQPKSCCICFDTKTGSLILGSLSLIGAISHILCVLSGHLGIILSAAWDQFTKDLPSETQQYKEHFILSVEIHNLAYYGLMLILSSLLIHGIRMDRPGLMRPYLIYMWTMITLTVIFSINVIVMALANMCMKTAFIFTAIFVILITICISINTYFVLVINAYYTKVKRTPSEDQKPLSEEFDIDNNGYMVKV